MKHQRTHAVAGVALVTAIAVGGGLLGATSATALWEKELGATGQVVAGSVATSAVVTAVKATITNDSYQTTHLARVVNEQPPSSGYSGTSAVILEVDPVPDTGLGAALSVAVWPVGSPADCTGTSEPAPGYESAEWIEGLSSEAVQTLPGDSALFCVRGYPTDSTPSPSAPAADQNRAIVAAQLGVHWSVSATGSQSFAPTFTATVRRGSFAARAAANGAPTISTSRIFNMSQISYPSPGVRGIPVALSNTCWKVGNLLAPAQPLVAYPAPNCVSGISVAPNERFVRTRIDGMNAYQMRADSTTASHVYLEASSDGSAVMTQVGNATELRQMWIPQVGPVGTSVQFVNAATGYCIQAPAASAGAFSMAPCGASNRFVTTWYAVSP